MIDWLRLVAMIFYAPLRGLREVRDRGSLFPAIISAYLSQVAYVFAVQWLSGNKSFMTRPEVVASSLFQAATSLLPIAIVLVPLLALTANLFDRRGSFGLVLQQDVQRFTDHFPHFLMVRGFGDKHFHLCSQALDFQKLIDGPDDDFRRLFRVQQMPPL